MMSFLVGRSSLYAIIDDDELTKTIKESYDLQAIFASLGILLSIVVIAGARRYNAILVVRSTRHSLVIQ